MIFWHISQTVIPSVEIVQLARSIDRIKTIEKKTGKKLIEIKKKKNYKKKHTQKQTNKQKKNPGKIERIGRKLY